MAGPISTNRALIRFVGLTAATLGIVQGLTYTIFAILSLLIYFQAMETTPFTDVQSAMYNTFLCSIEIFWPREYAAALWHIRYETSFIIQDTLSCVRLSRPSSSNSCCNRAPAREKQLLKMPSTRVGETSRTNNLNRRRPNSPKNSMERCVSLHVLDKSDVESDSSKPIVTPFVFNIFMYFYLVLSFVWFLISSVLWQKMFRRKWQNAPYFLGGWSCLTIIISVLDIILMSLIAHDLDNIINLGESQSAKSTAVAIVMTLAAKGYILWIANVFYACLSLKYARNLHTEPQRTASIIDAYAVSQRPWELADNATLYDEANAANFEFTNKAYTDDYGIPVFSSRSQSFQHLHMNESNRNQTNLNPLSNTNSLNNDVMRKNARNTAGNDLYQTPLDNDQFILGPRAPEIPRIHPNPDYDPEDQAPPIPNRTAKIGKQGQGRRTPPLNVRPPIVEDSNTRGPYIPEPDYTPPGSPKVKSVLRPKSNYVL